MEYERGYLVDRNYEEIKRELERITPGVLEAIRELEEASNVRRSTLDMGFVI